MVSRIPYNRDPDFSRPLFRIPGAAHDKMLSRLIFLYGEKQARQWMPELERLLQVHYAHKPQELIEQERACNPAERFTERDFVLITYGDIIQGDHGKNLRTLHRFVESFNRGAINTIHLLPFFPYSSDRGFAVVDFSSVDPNLGTWECVRDMGADYDLMFDVVMNHCSSRSAMFREYLRGNPQYRDYFIAFDSPDDLTEDQRSKIFRPRTSDVLTRFDAIDGPKYVWTTFSHDQIDFNFRNPAVLLDVLDGVMMYVRRGADIIRLDAVTYLWCEPGTECVHLPETHAIVKLLRDMLDLVAPGVALITETNVPHQENISYFGNGRDEAHMVYNFALPPLVLHTMYAQDASALLDWAEGLAADADAGTFFNILDTHDGIGVMGVRGILSSEQIAALIANASARGAIISYKSTEAGEEPYELNTTWWSAINDEQATEELLLQVQRYVASRSLALVIKGVPGLYTHGAAALSSDHERALRTGVNRDVNRGDIDGKQLLQALQDSASRLSLLRTRLTRINLARTRSAAFHPRGEQRVLRLDVRVCSMLRVAPRGEQRILALTNVTDRQLPLDVPLSMLGSDATCWRDVIGGEAHSAQHEVLTLVLGPYDILWLTPDSEYHDIPELAQALHTPLSMADSL